ncbi:MAG TPA: 3-oxoacyl-ACP reductase FabG [Bacillota bacterium]|nr:3-oxoacyl-ACP reductase FabG [Bacillota bacterium]HOK68478.1 3-oxoacyl-ACP reductase FabG [Bacillota bacterium]HPP85106.1 3-oxoacyl-ACP reductase FabG [Bacillota bacterium]
MKKALVTGGARGIGRAICKAFAEAGYFVIINYHKSREAAEELHKALPHSAVFQADVANRDEVARMVEAHPDIDVLVNNAGVSVFGVFDGARAEEVRRMYEVNLFGALNVSRAVLPSMLRRKSGVIINVSSIWGEIGASCEVDYSASKSALIGFTKALAKEVGPCNIRVNCVCPGIIDTDMNARLTIEEVENIVESIPLERLGKPEDVANAVLFLASEKADYISGAVLSVNGGL